MKNIIVMGVAGIGLFVGSVVGLLGATGRLNYEGTRGIPVLSGMFEAPPEGEGEGQGEGQGPEGADGHGATDGTDDGHGSAADVKPRNLDKAISSTDKLDDIFAEPEADAHGAPAAGGDGHGEAAGETHDNGNRMLDDIFAEVPEDDGHGGGGGGDGHQDDAHAEGTSRNLADLERYNQRPGAGEDPLDKEHRYVMEALQNATDYEYETGRYFDFKGQNGSISPTEINRFVALLQERAGRIESKGKALGEREKELQSREMDVADQQQALARARQAFEERQRQFDSQVEDFNRKVRLIQSQEEPMLKSNAKALEGFEMDVAARWVGDLWQDTEDGRSEVLKTMFFMNKDKANKLLNEIGKRDPRMLEDILRKRKELAVESAAGK